jgi:hypothetical protein
MPFGSFRMERWQVLREVRIEMHLKEVVRPW